jgi:hypothetical protein
MRVLTFLLLAAFSCSAKGQTHLSQKNDYLTGLESNLNKLQKDVDSLEHALKFIKENDYKSFEVINSVSNYYENAWVKLLYLITILGAITGVLLPIYLARLQKKELQINKEEFKEYVDKEVFVLEKRILDFNKTEIATTKSEIDLQTQKKNRSTIWDDILFTRPPFFISQPTSDRSYQLYFVS